MSARVTFASARPKELRADATLPALLDRMLAKWRFKKRFGGKRVAIKMHLGGNLGFSTIHPLLVSRVVRAVKQVGGKPFVADTPGAVLSARERGYTEETIGAPLVAVTGPADRYVYPRKVNYRTLKAVNVAGGIADADAMIVPDIGIIACDDLVACERAALDLIKEEHFIEGSLPHPLRRTGRGHLFQQIHAKDPFVQVQECSRLGLGTDDYGLSMVR